MKLKIHTRFNQFGLIMACKPKSNLRALIDKSIRPIGTCCFAAGIGAYAMGMSPAADYLLAAGVLLHLGALIGNWWEKD